MAENWYNKNNQKSRNLKSMLWIQNEIEMNKRLGLYEAHFGIGKIFTNIQITDIRRKKEILEIAKHSRNLYGLLNEIGDWTGNEDELLEVARMHKSLASLPKRNINWAGKEKELLTIAKDSDTGLLGIPIIGMDWTPYKDDILEIIKQHKVIERDWIGKYETGYWIELAKNEKNIFMQLLNVDIDWNGYEEIIFEIAKKHNIYIGSVAKANIDWKGKEESFLELAEQTGNIYDLPTEGMDWSKHKDRLIKILKKQRSFYGLPTNLLEPEEILGIAEEQMFTEGLATLDGINWLGYEERLLSIVEKRALASISLNENSDEKIDYYYPLRDLPKENINWNSKKEKILELAKMQGNLKGIQSFKFTWVDEDKDKLMEIVEIGGMFAGLPTSRELDWSDKKENIISIVEKNKNLFDLRYYFSKLEFSGYEERLLDIVKESKSFFGLPKKGLNWMGREDELLRIAEEHCGSLHELPKKGLNWNSKRKEILEIANRIRNSKRIRRFRN